MAQRRPLDDVRVIDLTIARAGPACVRQLADWGADVIRIEPPPGDEAAGSVGQLRHGPDFQNLHRNKRAIGLNLKSGQGRELFGRLAQTADVVVENMRPAVKTRLGVDYESVRATNPRVVYASISGYGQSGPYADRGGVDQIAQGMGGLMSVTGTPGTPPTRAGIPVSDLTAGLQLAIGVLAALHERDRTGEGQWVQTSLLEAMIALMDFQAARYTIAGEVAVQEGNHHPTLVPMGCFATADGHVNIAGSGGRLLRNLCDAIGLPDLPDDPRFDTPHKRSANRTELNALIQDRLHRRTTAEWIEMLNAHGVPCGPIYSMDEVFDDPQVRHLGMTRVVRHPFLGDLNVIRNAVTSSAGGPAVSGAAPESGQHTDEVLAELGLTRAEIAELRAGDVVA